MCSFDPFIFIKIEKKELLVDLLDIAKCPIILFSLIQIKAYVRELFMLLYVYV